MDPKIQELHHRVLDGRPELLPLLHHIHMMTREVDVLKWLIANDYTGHRLMQWWNYEHKLSILSIPRFVVAELEKEKKVRALFAGRDFFKRQ